MTKNIGVSEQEIKSSLKSFTPAFGRQEILKVDGKNVQIFLSKNPTSFNESLRTIADLKAPARNATQSVAGGKNVLLVLNDRIPDGRDVSWIWDVDFEDYVNKFSNITVSGDRTYDMALRMRYAIQNSKLKGQNYGSTSSPSRAKSRDNSKVKIYEDLGEAIKNTLKILIENKTLFILPTYSAMLEVRKILTGKKIL